MLLVHAAAGVGADALRAALVRLGLDVLPDAGRPGEARVAVPPGADPSAVAARAAAARGLVRAVEADAVVRAARVPDDPLYAERQANYLQVIHAPEAWERTTGDHSVVIAIVDSGVDYTHQEFRGRFALNPGETLFNGRDDDGNGCIDDIAGCSFVSLATADPSCGYTEASPNWRAFDDEGHGSFVAGLAAAAGNDGRGITGVAWDARILPVKVLDCTATGRISDAAAGIRYAAAMGADVINISFGTPTDSLALREAIAFAERSGAVVVASAGNDGRRGVTFPAAYPGVIAVAASGFVGPDGLDYRQTAVFSSFGSGVDVIAPGVAVVGPLPEALCGRRGWTCVEGPYAVASGSSFAAPLVAGAVALERAEHPGLSAALVRSLVLQGNAPASAPGEAGVLDIAAALAIPLYGAGVPGTSRPGGGPLRVPGN